MGMRVRTDEVEDVIVMQVFEWRIVRSGRANRALGHLGSYMYGKYCALHHSRLQGTVQSKEHMKNRAE